MTPDFDQAKRYVSERLKTGLPADLYFHNAAHTLEDVLPATERLAGKAGIAGEDLLLLRTASLFHDAGYLERYEGHEEASAGMAADALPGLGYSPAQIDRIQSIILATRLRDTGAGLLQAPDEGDLLQALMCDADLDNLGREDFFALGHQLRREWNGRGASIGLREWYELSLDFLERHTYFTDAAQSLRDEGKRANLREIRLLLGEA